MNRPVAPFHPGLTIEPKSYVHTRVKGKAKVREVLLDENQVWWIKLHGRGFAFIGWHRADDFRETTPEPEQQPMSHKDFLRRMTSH